MRPFGSEKDLKKMKAAMKDNVKDTSITQDILKRVKFAMLR